MQWLKPHHGPFTQFCFWGRNGPAGTLCPKFLKEVIPLDGAGDLDYCTVFCTLLCYLFHTHGNGIPLVEQPLTYVEAHTLTNNGILRIVPDWKINK